MTTGRDPLRVLGANVDLIGALGSRWRDTKNRSDHTLLAIYGSALRSCVATFEGKSGPTRHCFTVSRCSPHTLWRSMRPRRAMNRHMTDTSLRPHFSRRFAGRSGGTATQFQRLSETMRRQDVAGRHYVGTGENGASAPAWQGRSRCGRATLRPKRCNHDCPAVIVTLIVIGLVAMVIHHTWPKSYPVATPRSLRAPRSSQKSWNARRTNKVARSITTGAR